MNAAEQLHELWLSYETRIDYFSTCIVVFGRPQECPVGTPARRRKNKPGARRQWRDREWNRHFFNRWAVAAFGVHPKHRMRRSAILAAAIEGIGAA